MNKQRNLVLKPQFLSLRLFHFGISLQKNLPALLYLTTWSILGIAVLVCLMAIPLVDSMSGTSMRARSPPHGSGLGVGSGGGDSSCCSKEGVCISVGVLGHVDSGKTSLCRALSQVVSTCGLDKHPQSKERGITLDLGFSAFNLVVPAAPHRCAIPKRANDARDTAPVPTETAEAVGEETAVAAACEAALPGATLQQEVVAPGGGRQEVQICLVDCPGHASLVRTVIGGAHIIDLAILVVDATKGVQAQTAGRAWIRVHATGVTSLHAFPRQEQAIPMWCLPLMVSLRLVRVHCNLPNHQKTAAGCPQ